MLSFHQIRRIVSLRQFFGELYDNMILWRENKVKQQHFVIALSLIVGIATAIAAICLKHLIHFIHSFLANNINIEGVNYLYLAFPAVGILLASLFVRFFIKDDISHGITKVLYAISQRKARIKPHNMWSSVVASTLTIGFGGSVGAEAPIVLTGSAIGSNLGRFFKMDQKVLMLMIGCGAAGAIGAIFNAPIAGFVFTLEVLMIDLTMSSIIPLLVASVTATSISYLFMGPEVMFKFQIYDAFNLERIPYLIVLGVVCGFVSLYFIRGINSMENIFRRIKNPYSKLAIGGATLSILIFLLPALYGEGYASISELLNENPYQVMEGSLFYRFKDYSWVLFMYLGLTLLFKIVATSATNGAGGTGGTFAPSLFVGCLTGYLVAMLLNTLGIAVPERNFAFAGMAGVISGVMHAPLTGIFLIAEITNGYSLFMSLMITSVVAYITINLFESHSIYAMRLAKTGELITHNKDKAVLTLMKMDSVIERDLMTVDPDMSFGSLVKIIPESQRNIFPVVNKNGVYLGEIQLDEIKNILFRQDLYHRFNMRKLMISPPARIYSDYSMEKVMKIFNLSKAWYLPVIDKQGHYLGHISQTTLFNAYRRMLVQFSDE